jgi:hypothetical protein
LSAAHVRVAVGGVMSEAQIARAYADRFSLHLSEHVRLLGMVADVGAGFDLVTVLVMDGRIRR